MYRRDGPKKNAFVKMYKLLEFYLNSSGIKYHQGKIVIRQLKEVHMNLNEV